LLNTNLVLLLHFLDAMGCDPDCYQDSILDAEGRVWPLPCHFYAVLPITLLPRLSCSLRWHRHRRQLQWLLRISEMTLGQQKPVGGFAKFLTFAPLQNVVLCLGFVFAEVCRKSSFLCEDFCNVGREFYEHRFRKGLLVLGLLQESVSSVYRDTETLKSRAHLF
jgi:hypothetical protein